MWLLSWRSGVHFTSSFAILFSLACNHVTFCSERRFSSSWITGCCICVCYSLLFTSVNKITVHIYSILFNDIISFSYSISLFCLLIISPFSLGLPLCLKYSDPRSPVTWLAGKQEAQMHFPLFWAESVGASVIVCWYDCNTMATALWVVYNKLNKSPCYMNLFVLVRFNHDV